MRRLIKISSLRLALVATVLACVSCDEVNWEERFDGPVALEMGKNVLIEDFTGQKCSNCPLAHAEVEKLQATYGKHRVVAVALHGGPQAVDDTNTKLLGLANEESKAYNRRWGSFSYPKGVVDRTGGLMDYEKWGAAAVKRFAVKPNVVLSIDAIMVDEQKQQLSFRTHVESQDTLQGRMVLWLTESDIKAIQTLPAAWGGGHQSDYLHQHVFRATINGMDGEAFRLHAKEVVEHDYTFTLKESWNPAHMALVMFFENDIDGVLQVIDTPLIPN